MDTRDVQHAFAWVTRGSAARPVAPTVVSAAQPRGPVGSWAPASAGMSREARLALGKLGRSMRTGTRSLRSMRMGGPAVHGGTAFTGRIAPDAVGCDGDDDGDDEHDDDEHEAGAQEHNKQRTQHVWWNTYSAGKSNPSAVAYTPTELMWLHVDAGLAATSWWPQPPSPTTQPTTQP